MTTKKTLWAKRFGWSIWACGWAGFLIHWGILSGWPPMTGLGFASAVGALVMLVSSGIGLFSEGFMDSWESQEEEGGGIWP